MRFLPFLMLGICASAALAQPDQTPTTIAHPPSRKMPVPPLPPAPQPQLRTGPPQQQIEVDLKQLFDLLNALSTEKAGYFGILDLISGARIGNFGVNEWADEFIRARGEARYRLDEIRFETLENDAARVQISYSLLQTVEGVNLNRQAVETLDLKRETVPWNQLVKWRIVPQSYEKLGSPRPGYFERTKLENVAYFASQRAGTYEQLRGELSVSHLNQCYLGARQFEQDYDDKFAFQNEFWRLSLRPYVKSDTVFLIPGTDVPYTFNDGLSEKTYEKLPNLAQTVLFYEGLDEKPAYRYAGKAAICFADGHVQFLTPDEAKTLIWRP